MLGRPAKALVVPMHLPATVGRRTMEAHPTMAPIMEAVEAGHASLVHATAARLVLDLQA